MDTEKRPIQNNHKTDLCVQILIGIFNIIVFICGVVLLIVNFYSPSKEFIEEVAYVAIIMQIIPSVYYLILLIKHLVKKKMIRLI